MKYVTVASQMWKASGGGAKARKASPRRAASPRMRASASQSVQQKLREMMSRRASRSTSPGIRSLKPRSRASPRMKMARKPRAATEIEKMAKMHKAEIMARVAAGEKYFTARKAVLAMHGYVAKARVARSPRARKARSPRVRKARTARVVKSPRARAPKRVRKARSPRAAGAKKRATPPTAQYYKDNKDAVKAYMAQNNMKNQDWMKAVKAMRA